MKPNLELPVLPFWQAKSFWATLLMVAATLLNMQGIDLYAVTCDAFAACTQEEVISKGQMVALALQEIAPIFLGLFAWWQRRAPNYRLGIKSDKSKG